MQMSTNIKNPSQGLKNRFPFRLGTTSFILPAGYADNVAFLGPVVDDVELLFFENEGIHSFPEPLEIRRLQQLKKEHSLSYTLHLPLGLRPGARDEFIRRKSMEPCRHLVAATAGLAPLAWILHVPAPAKVQPVEFHFERLERSIEELEKEGVDRKKLCLETLDYPFVQVLELVDRHDVSLCIDIGHLVLNGFSVEECLAACLKRCRVVHLHGIRGRKDHQEICHLEPSIIQKVIDTLTRHTGSEKVLTLEVFGQEAFINSMNTMKGYLP